MAVEHWFYFSPEVIQQEEKVGLGFALINFSGALIGTDILSDKIGSFIRCIRDEFEHYY